MSGTTPHNVRVPVRLRKPVRDKVKRTEISSTAIVRAALRAFVDDPDEAGAVIAYGIDRDVYAETEQLSYRLDDGLWKAAQDRVDELAEEARDIGVMLSASLVAVRALDRFANETDEESAERLGAGAGA